MRFGEHPGPCLPAPIHSSHRHEKGSSVCFKARHRKRRKNKLLYAATGTSKQHKGPAGPQQPEHDSALPHKETLGQHFEWSLPRLYLWNLFPGLVCSASPWQHLPQRLPRCVKCSLFRGPGASTQERVRRKNVEGRIFGANINFSGFFFFLKKKNPTKEQQQKIYSLKGPC